MTGVAPSLIVRRSFRPSVASGVYAVCAFTVLSEFKQVKLVNGVVLLNTSLSGFGTVGLFGPTVLPLPTAKLKYPFAISTLVKFSSNSTQPLLSFERIFTFTVVAVRASFVPSGFEMLA
jgi:hypothetical protein